jgi:hypothetical protein
MKKSSDLEALTVKMTKMSGGSDPVSAAYESSDGGTAATATQVVSVLEAHLPNDSPSGSIAAFKHSYPNAQVVNAGSLGGQAACEESDAGSTTNVAMCVWFDNDSFGAIISPTMNASALANVMLKIRPAVELTAK